MRVFVWIIVLVVMGLIGALVGKGKGRQAEGFWWGALLGLIGVLIIALRNPTDAWKKANEPKVEEKTDGRPVYSGDQLVCGHCGKPMDSWFSNCLECGKYNG